MEPMYYIGLDVHKRKISYCVKDNSGRVFAEGLLSATRLDLDHWMKTLPQPWTAAMEATMFTGWIYDHLKPHAAALKVAHPLMLRAIAAAKKKNDRMDAGKICDCLRCDFLPESYMASTAIRERRRTLRYRNLLVRQMVQMKIKTSALLMEAGVSYNKQRLHKAGYFRELLATNPDIDEGQIRKYPTDSIKVGDASEQGGKFRPLRYRRKNCANPTGYRKESPCYLAMTAKSARHPWSTQIPRRFVPQL